MEGVSMSEFDRLMAKKAAALRYDPDKNGAPVVVASGMGYMAEKITETAMKAGVPVYEDDSLALLLTKLDLGAEIPPELYQAIVEIYVYFLGFTADKTAGNAENKEQTSGQNQTSSQRQTQSQRQTPAQSQTPARTRAVNRANTGNAGTAGTTADNRRSR